MSWHKTGQAQAHHRSPSIRCEVLSRSDSDIQLGSNSDVQPIGDLVLGHCFVKRHELDREPVKHRGEPPRDSWWVIGLELTLVNALANQFGHHRSPSLIKTVGDVPKSRNSQTGGPDLDPQSPSHRSTRWAILVEDDPQSILDGPVRGLQREFELRQVVFRREFTGTDDDILKSLEVVKNQRGADAERITDVRGTHMVDPLLGNEVERGGEDLIAPIPATLALTQLLSHGTNLQDSQSKQTMPASFFSVRYK